MVANGAGDGLTELAVTARDGDLVAIDAFVKATYRDVWRFCASLEGTSRADDLTQEVFVRVLRALPSYRADASGRTWLFAVARHALADDARSRRRRQRRGDLASRRPRDVLCDPTQTVDLLDLLGRVDLDRRGAFVLTQVMGFTYAEAAAVYGCPVGTIRSRVARARSLLLEALTAAAMP